MEGSQKEKKKDRKRKRGGEGGMEGGTEGGRKEGRKNERKEKSFFCEPNRQMLILCSCAPSSGSLEARLLGTNPGHSIDGLWLFYSPGEVFLSCRPGEGQCPSAGRSSSV